MIWNVLLLFVQWLLSYFLFINSKEKKHLYTNFSDDSNNEQDRKAQNCIHTCPVVSS